MLLKFISRSELYQLKLSWKIKISLMPEKWNFVKILGPLKKEVRQCLQIDGCKCSF